MSEIQIINEMPVIFTKDRQWLEDTRHLLAEPGSIVLLPEDAVLVKAPDNTPQVTEVRLDTSSLANDKPRRARTGKS